MGTDTGTAYANWSSSFMQLVYGPDILYFIAIDVETSWGCWVSEESAKLEHLVEQKETYKHKIFKDWWRS